MEQQSADWLAWRTQGIGSSDAPVIMEVSPWKSPLQLWEEKLGKAKPQTTNWAQQRGIDLEPKARAYYETLENREMPPTLLEHPKYGFLRASLDGYNAKSKRILEIKCPGREDHAKAVAGQVPEKYIWQLYHQLLVADADQVDYFSYDGQSGAIVPFYRDEKAEKKLLAAEVNFWELVQSKTPPAPTDKDYAVVKDSESERLFKRWKTLDARAGAVLEELKEIEAEIKRRHEKESRIQCAGVKLLRFQRSGSVDYAKIPELAGVDLERYRKAPLTVTQISRIKKP
jgi:putative phage-type endonuclease